MLFVSPCELCDFLEPKGLIPGPQGLKRVQDPFPFFLFLFGCAGPCSLTGFSLAVSRGSSRYGAWARGCKGFRSSGSQTVEHRLNSSATQASLLCGIWDIPGSGIKFTSPGLAGRFFTSEPPGKAHIKEES